MVLVCNKRHLPFCSLPLVCKCIVSEDHGFSRDAVLRYGRSYKFPLMIYIVHHERGGEN